MQPNGNTCVTLKSPHEESWQPLTTFAWKMAVCACVCICYMKYCLHGWYCKTVRTNAIQLQYNCNTKIFLVLQLYCACADCCNRTKFLRYFIVVVFNLCGPFNRIYSTFPVQVDASHWRSGKLDKNLSESACLACHQLQQMPCGFAHASPARHRHSATLILTSLLALIAGLLASDSPCTLSMHNFINT